MMRKDVGTINNRINVKGFKNWKTIGLGAEDATARYGKNIPYETPTNFSAGYMGGAMVELRKAYKKGEK